MGPGAGDVDARTGPPFRAASKMRSPSGGSARCLLGRAGRIGVAGGCRGGRGAGRGASTACDASTGASTAHAGPHPPRFRPTGPSASIRQEDGRESSTRPVDHVSPMAAPSTRLESTRPKLDPRTPLFAPLAAGFGPTDFVFFPYCFPFSLSPSLAWRDSAEQS